jgi:aminopeptidase-like protein
MNNLIGLDIYKLASKIFPINRSITGNGVRDTFELIREEIPELNIYEIPSGEQIFD